MRMCKAPELLKKAATVFKSKTDTLRTNLFVLASLRFKMATRGLRRGSMVRAAVAGARAHPAPVLDPPLATVQTISRRIHALVSSDRENQTRLDYGDRALVLHKVAAGIQEPATTDHEQDGVIDLSEVAMFAEDDHDYYPDWTHSLFNDEYYYNDDDEEEGGYHDEHGTPDALDEPSVMDIIRSNREVEGLEFNMNDEIDQACDMFIKRFRKRMNRSF